MIRWPWQVPAIVLADAGDLIDRFGDQAYREARDRARIARQGLGDRPTGHWDRVAKEISRRTGRETGLDTSTRYLGGRL